MAKKIRPPFDINKEFIVVKPFNYNGHKFTPVDPQTNGPMIFFWRRIACSPKELYKYWDLRWLECKSEENIKGVNFDNKPVVEKREVKEPVVEKREVEKPEKNKEVSKPKAFAKTEGTKNKKE